MAGFEITETKLKTYVETVPYGDCLNCDREVTKYHDLSDRQVREVAVDLLTEILKYCKLTETRFQSLVREAKLRLEESKK